MKPKTQSELFDELPLVERIGHVMVEYNIPSKSQYPYKDWVNLIAWELKTTIEDVENELEKMFVEPLNN